MLMPKRVKRRKVQRGRLKGSAHKGNQVTYGDFGLVALEPAWITSRQIEAARIAMTRYIKRGGQVWIKIFPDKPITQKPAETRMGSGKGSPEYWVAVVKPGTVMKASEIRKLSAAEMDAKLAELKKELFNLRFQQAVNQLDNPMRISAVKKDIARIKTVQRDIELHGANS